MLPQDFVIALKLAVSRRAYTYAELAREVGMSASQVHGAVERADRSGFVRKDTMAPVIPNILEFALHGAKYLFPPEHLPEQRGIPTAHSAPPLNDRIRSGSLLVWPYPEGDVRGEGLRPIHKSVPFASRQDEKFYQALALLDALRAGRSREQRLAGQLLTELLQNDGS
jgi:DNA-binding Lrp family transcriptional regulator